MAHLRCEKWSDDNTEYKNTNMGYLTKKAYILCQHHGLRIDNALAQHIEILYMGAELKTQSPIDQMPEGKL